MINPNVKAENISSEVRFDEETDKWVAHVVEWIRLNFLERICEWIWGEKDYEYSVETIWTCSSRGTHTLWRNVDDPDDTIPWWLARGLRGQTIEEEKRKTQKSKTLRDMQMMNNMNRPKPSELGYIEVTDLDMVLMPIK